MYPAEDAIVTAHRSSGRGRFARTIARHVDLENDVAKFGMDRLIPASPFSSMTLRPAKASQVRLTKEQRGMGDHQETLVFFMGFQTAPGWPWPSAAVPRPVIPRDAISAQRSQIVVRKFRTRPYSAITKTSRCSPPGMRSGARAPKCNSPNSTPSGGPRAVSRTSGRRPADRFSGNSNKSRRTWPRRRRRLEHSFH
jgi:hypothetical protein